MKLFFVFISTLFFCASLQAQDSTIIIMGFPRAGSSVYFQITKAIFDEAFKRIGYKMVIKSCVPENCGDYVLNGSIDGELARVSGYDTLFTDLVIVDEPYILLELGAFSKKEIKDISNWESLRNKNYQITFIRGYQLTESKLLQLIKEENILPASNLTDALDKVEKGEADIFIGRERSVLNEIKKRGFDIFKISTIENQAGIYAYMHKKYIPIARQLTVALRQMKKSGQLQKIIDSFETEE